MKARAALADGKGGFFIDDIDVGEPGPNEVLIQIKASGVCHTDHKILYRQSLCIMGHEGAGVVLKTGPGVRKVAAGDRVLLNWAMPCGECYYCQNGLQNVCEAKPAVSPERFNYKGRALTTSFGLGTMSTATIVPVQAVIKIDVEIPFTSACTMGCCVMTGYGSVHNVAKVQAGQSVVVIGTGAVGLCTIQGARIAGAAKIIGVDVKPNKLKMAERFGATHTLLADRHDEGLAAAAIKIKALTDGRGADFAFECTSVPALGAAPLAMVRHGGMAVQISGIEEKVKIDMELFEWDKTYINPLYGKCQPERDFPKLLELYSQKKLMLDEMVTGIYKLDQLKQAFDDMFQGVNAKAVLTME